MSYIEQALIAAGYGHADPTEEKLIECFRDYAAAGYWGDLDLIEADERIASGEITVADMCRALIEGS